jgi:quinol-cytochrome oxidoreductase complex cytochrome b subunit
MTRDHKHFDHAERLKLNFVSPPYRRTVSTLTAQGLSAVRRIVLWVLTAEVAVLLVTGVALFFLYRPATDRHWTELLGTHESWDVKLAHGIRLVHRLASLLAVATAVAAGVLVTMRGSPTLRRWSGAVVGLATALATLAASFTGFLLPFDQIAVWAVTVGTNMRGYRMMFGDQVRFVIIGSSEISRVTLIRWLLIHMLVLGPLVVIAVALAWRRAWTDGPRPSHIQESTCHDAGSPA